MVNSNMASQICWTSKGFQANITSVAPLSYDWCPFCLKVWAILTFRRRHRASWIIRHINKLRCFLRIWIGLYDNNMIHISLLLACLLQVIGRLWLVFLLIIVWRRKDMTMFTVFISYSRIQRPSFYFPHLSNCVFHTLKAVMAFNHV